MYIKVNTGELPIDTLRLKKSALIIKAINHPLRQRILLLLHEKGRTTVTEVYKTFGVVQPLASQHLAILLKAGFVFSEREGKRTFYSVHYQRLTEVQKLVHDLLS